MDHYVSTPVLEPLVEHPMTEEERIKFHTDRAALTLAGRLDARRQAEIDFTVAAHVTKGGAGR